MTSSDVPALFELPAVTDDAGDAGVAAYELLPLDRPVAQANAWIALPPHRSSRDLSWFTDVFGATLSLHARADRFADDERLLGMASASGEDGAGGGASLYEQLKDASEELERRIQEATADIAEQNDLLRRQALELEQASAMKSQFLANMSHEFRTPLNAILGNASMLLQGVAGPLDAGPRRQVSRIESNGRHLLAIIDEMLDISRIEAGRMPLDRTSFRLDDLLADVRAELEPTIARTAVAVVLDVEGELPMVDSDRQKLKQIVHNLASNAVKFTHRGRVTLRARAADGGSAVDIDVVDTGIGIPAADHDRIFDDFLQLDDSPTRPYGGTGLGLSICRRLAQMIGARLSVQSQVGHGSTFTVTLPLQGRK